jgi:hypothetical protein
LGLDTSIGLDTGNANGQQVQWPGKFVKLTDDWLVIQRKERETWIPIENIMAFNLIKPSAE